MAASDTTPGTDRASEVCSLPKDQLQERLAMLRREILTQVKRTEELDNGLAWEFEASPKMRAKLEQLVEFERQCCSGLDWSLREDTGSQTLRLAVEGVNPRSGVFASLGGPEATRP